MDSSLVVKLTIQHARHRRFPESLHFTLNNPIRSFLDPPQKLISRLDVGPRDVVVDFGCGTGFFAIHLAKIAGRAIGIDVSQKMLEIAAANVRKSGLSAEFLESDGTDIGLENESVDLIILVHVFHEVENKPRVLSEFSRIMKQLGRLVIVEKTRGTKRFSGILGPPVIDQTQVILEIERDGFVLIETIPSGKDTIIIGKKRASSVP